MAAITFRGRVETVYNMDGTAYQRIRVPTVLRRLFDGDYLRMDRIPPAVGPIRLYVDRSEVLATVTVQTPTHEPERR